MDAARASTSEARRKDAAALAKGGVINLLGSASKSVFAAVLLLVLSRSLGAGGAGVFLEATGLFLIVATSAALGVETGFIRTLSRGRATGMTSGLLPRVLLVGLLPVLVVGSVSSVALFHYAAPIAELIGNGQRSTEIALYLRTLAPFVPIAALAQGVIGATRGFETMTPTVITDRFGKLGLQTLLVGLAVVSGARVEIVALSWVLPVLASLVVSGTWLARLWRSVDLSRSPRDGGPFRTGHGPSTVQDAALPVPPATMWEIAREFWGFTLPRSIASIFSVVVQWLDVLLVGALLSPEAAGIYAASTRLISLGIAVAAAVGDVSQPMVGRLMAAGDRDATRSLYGTATAWQMLLTWPQYIFVSAFAATLLGVFGPEFVVGWPVVIILAASGMVGAGAGPVDMVLLMAGKSMWSLWNTGLALGINVGLNLLLIPVLGIRGAAIAWAASRVVSNVVPLIQTSTSMGLHPFGQAWVAAAALSTACFGLTSVSFLLILSDPSLGAIAVLGGLSSLLYAGLLYQQRRQLRLDDVITAVRRRVTRRSGNSTLQDGSGRDFRPMQAATADSASNRS